MIATGCPPFRRPCAARAAGPRLTVSTFRESLGAGILERFSTSGQARIGHEIPVRIERFLTWAGNDAPAPTRGKNGPALLVVKQVRQHDLVEHLLMHSRIEDGQQRFDPPVEV